MAHDVSKLEIYNLAVSLVKDIYELCSYLPQSEDRNLISQMKRAVVSVPLNLVEGSARFTKKSSLQFFFYAYGSLKELAAILKICYSLGFVSPTQYNEVYKKVDTLCRKCYCYMKSFNEMEYYSWFTKKRVRK